MEGQPSLVLERFNALPSMVQDAVLDGLKLKKLDEGSINALTIGNLKGLAKTIEKDSRLAVHQDQAKDLLTILTEHRRLMDLEKMPEKEGLLKKIGGTIWRHKISLGLSMLALVGGLHYFKYIDLKKIPQVGTYLADGVDKIGALIAVGLAALSAKAKEFWSWFQKNVLTKFRTGNTASAAEPGAPGKPPVATKPPVAAERTSPSPSDKPSLTAPKPSPGEIGPKPSTVKPERTLPPDPAYDNPPPRTATPRPAPLNPRVDLSPPLPERIPRATLPSPEVPKPLPPIPEPPKPKIRPPSLPPSN